MLNIEQNKKIILASIFVIILIVITIINYAIFSNSPLERSDSVALITNEKLVLGIFPRRNSAKTIRMFNPIAQYLSQEIGVKVEIATANDFYTFWNNVKAKKYDIVHYNQLHYILSNIGQAYSIILKNNEFGSSTIKPTISVLKESTITSLKDLKNKTIQFGGGRLAMSSHVANRVAIRALGIDDNDYKWSYAKNPPETIRAVYNFIADAASTGDVILKFPEVKRAFKVSKFRKIHVGPELPHLPWAVSENISIDLKLKIQTLLLQLNKNSQGKAMLRNASLTGLAMASDKEYDVVRKIYRQYTRYNQTH